MRLRNAIAVELAANRRRRRRCPDAAADADVDAEESVKSNSKNLLVKFKSFSNLITDK